jgi:hypothetical protein
MVLSAPVEITAEGAAMRMRQACIMISAAAAPCPATQCQRSSSSISWRHELIFGTVFWKRREGGMAHWAGLNGWFNLVGASLKGNAEID